MPEIQHLEHITPEMEEATRFILSRKYEPEELEQEMASALLYMNAQMNAVLESEKRKSQ